MSFPLTLRAGTFTDLNTDSKGNRKKIKNEKKKPNKKPITKLLN